MYALSAAKTVGPAKALFLQARTFRLWPNLCGVAGTVSFAKRVTTSHQRNGFFVVHRHTRKGIPDIIGRGKRIGPAIWSLGIHIDQAHLHSCERVGKLALAAVAFVVQPYVFRAPVDVFFRFPNIHASSGETKGFEPHRFEGAIAA